MIMERFRPEHLWQINLQPAQRSWYEHASPEYAEALAQGLAYTGRNRHRRIIVCGGIIDIDANTGHLWCFLAMGARPYFVRLHRTAQRFIDLTGKQTLYATSEAHFEDGCRWLELLGFKRNDELLHGFGPDGADHVLFSRVT